MSILKRTFNIYCDESRVENLDSSYMIIGAIIIPRLQKFNIVNGIKQIRERHNFTYEIKWTKVRKRFSKFYKELVDYFIKTKEMQYRCIIVDKDILDYETYHDSDEELAFFKFYYFMLKAKLLPNCKYYIFLDKKPTRDKNRARSLYSYLEFHILLRKPGCSIEHLQAYESYDSELIQLADFFSGLVGFAVNDCVENKQKNEMKVELVGYLKSKMDIDDFEESTSLFEEKFNRFNWTGCEDA